MSLYAALTAPHLTAQHCDPKYLAPPHIRILGSRIRDEVAKGSARIIVTMPPRHGKSELCSKWTPIWFLENWPEKRVVLASYGANFAKEWGRKVRNSFRLYGDILATSITEDSKAADLWNTPEDGGMATCGVDGTLTGRGADLLIIDDPVKNAAEARSETYRQRAWEWWTETARTRLEPGGSVIVIMTRWHQDDLVGRLLEQDEETGAGVWTVVNCPALAEDNDPMGRSTGDALWPERYDVKTLGEIKADIGERAFSALYGQRPTAKEGEIFRAEHFRYFKDEPDYWTLVHADGTEQRILKREAWIGQTADTAMKDGQENDWTVVLTYAVTKQRQLLVLRVDRVKLPVPKQWAFIKQCRARWRRLGNYRALGIEDKQSGIGLIQTAQLEGDPVVPLEAVADKVTRATPASVMCENGMVFFPIYAPWLASFEDELLDFPNGVHDDQVDAFSYAGRQVKSGGLAIMSDKVDIKPRDRAGVSIRKPAGWR